MYIYIYILYRHIHIPTYILLYLYLYIYISIYHTVTYIYRHIYFYMYIYISHSIYYTVVTGLAPFADTMQIDSELVVRTLLPASWAPYTHTHARTHIYIYTVSILSSCVSSESFRTRGDMRQHTSAYLHHACHQNRFGRVGCHSPIPHPSLPSAPSAPEQRRQSVRSPPHRK